MLERFRNLIRDLRAQRAEVAELRAALDDSRRALDRFAGITQSDLRSANRLLLELTTFVHERLAAPGEIEATIQAGWRRALPTPELTWNAEMTGDEFFGHCTAACGKQLGRVIEIGPGYGRVLKTILASDAQLESYHGLDLSPENVKHLQGTFTDPRLRFSVTDFLTHRVEAPVQLVYSSAVFLHLYPSIVPALGWSHGALADGGHLCFDVPQGRARYIDASWGLFVHEYEESELRDLVAAAGFSGCTITAEREFAPDVGGWFVAARR